MKLSVKWINDYSSLPLSCSLLLASAYFHNGRTDFSCRICSAYSPPHWPPSLTAFTPQLLLGWYLHHHLMIHPMFISSGYIVRILKLNNIENTTCFILELYSVHSLISAFGHKQFQYNTCGAISQIFPGTVIKVFNSFHEASMPPSPPLQNMRNIQLSLLQTYATAFSMINQLENSYSSHGS